tara:strand:+ start:349 stop:561 length:213 start_codon:yes stop_codon:yes gene_type:complete
MGETLGILLDPTTNKIIVDSVINQIDVESSVTQYNIAVDNNLQTATNVKKALIHRFNPIASCNTILLNEL